EIEDGVVQRGLARAHAHRRHTALQCGDATVKDVRGGVSDPGVAISWSFEIEKSRAVLCAIKGVRDRLVNRHRNGVCRRVRTEAAMNRDRFAAHEGACRSKSSN